MNSNNKKDVEELLATKRKAQPINKVPDSINKVPGIMEKRTNK